jgi:hypothetical protein
MTENLRKYLAMERVELVDAYAEVLQQLAILAVEVADAKVAERRAEMDGFRRSEESSVSGRERDARLNALDMTCEVWERQSEEKALLAEKELIVWLLDASE